MKRAFITGATGFLGCEMAAQLVARGVEVLALTRSGALPGDLVARGVTPVRGDLDDAPRLAGAVRGVDVVFHAAASVAMWHGEWAESVRANVHGTRALVDAMLSAGVPRLVLTSSASTIGKPDAARRGEVVTIDENSAYNLGPLHLVYPHTKWLSEEEALRGAERGLSVVITHPTAIFGPGDWKLNLLPLFRGALRGTLVCVPRGMRTTCDVRDVANAHIELALRGRPERYILGGESVTIRELITRIARIVGGRAPLLTMPHRATLALGAAMDAVADVTGHPPAFGRELAIQSTFTARLSSDKAAGEVGYRSRSLDDSLRDAATWYRAHGHL